MFNFNLAQTAEERLDVLESFIKFWMNDDWRDDFGIPESELDKYKLPYPLKRLYSFAGKLPPASDEHDYTDSAFSIQDHLSPLDHLKYTDDGRVEFLWENQGNWSCRTLCEGEDPPVWVENNDCLYEDLEPGVWVQCSDSLSNFLITYCLIELIFGAKLYLSTTGLEALFVTENHQFTDIWQDGGYVNERKDFDFYLWQGDVLVSNVFGGVFASNSAEGIDLIKRYQGEIVSMRVDVQSATYCWSIEIKDDGSGEISLPGHYDSAARFPKSTFDFRRIRYSLLKIGTEWGGPSGRDDKIFFRRENAPATSGVNVPRQAEIEELVRQALASISEKEDDFDWLLNEYPVL